MKYNTSTMKKSGAITGKILSWIFGIAFLAIGIINLFWGNDGWFGIFIVLLSFVYFLPVNSIFRKIAGEPIPKIGRLKILLGILLPGLQ